MIGVVKLRPGQTLRSAVSEVEALVVKAPSAEAVLACGGVAMLRDGQPASDVASSPGSPRDGAELGKRDVDEAIGPVLLCSRPGAGGLTVDGRALVLEGAKPLPASD